MPFRIGPWEIVLILLIVLIIFGAGKLPQVGGAIGKGLREFRKAQSGIDETSKPTDDTLRLKKEKTKARLKD
ncbi:MAG: twin-arginine translocase TatA/TatE family subunit [Dehalococcoidales bacterium]